MTTASFRNSILALMLVGSMAVSSDAMAQGRRGGFGGSHSQSSSQQSGRGSASHSRSAERASSSSSRSFDRGSASRSAERSSAATQSRSAERASGVSTYRANDRASQSATRSVQSNAGPTRATTAQREAGTATLRGTGSETVTRRSTQDRPVRYGATQGTTATAGSATSVGTATQRPGSGYGNTNRPNRGNNGNTNNNGVTTNRPSRPGASADATTSGVRPGNATAGSTTSVGTATQRPGFASGDNNRPNRGNNANGNADRPNRGNNGNGNNYGNADRPNRGNNRGGNNYGNADRPNRGNNRGGNRDYGKDYDGRRPGYHTPQHNNPRGYNNKFNSRFHENYRCNRWSWDCPYRPPHRPWRPAPWVVYRPVVPVGWSWYAPAPRIYRVLGIQFGTVFSVSINHLFTYGYNIDGYCDNVIYLRDVPMLNFSWPNVMLNYAPGGGLATAMFSNSFASRDMAMYDRLYNTLCNTYGAPVEASTGPYEGRVSWWGGEGQGYVTLNYYTEGGRFYTNLTIGN